MIAYFIAPYEMIPKHDPDELPMRRCKLSNHKDINNMWRELEIYDPDEKVGRCIVYMDVPASKIKELEEEKDEKDNFVYERLPSNYLTNMLLRAQLETPPKKPIENYITEELECKGDFKVMGQLETIMKDVR